MKVSLEHFWSWVICDLAFASSSFHAQGFKEGVLQAFPEQIAYFTML